MPSTAEVDLEQRIQDVADWVLEGVRYTDLVAKCCSTFKVCKRTADSYIGKANAIARETRQRQKETMVNRATAQLERIHDKAYSRDDCSAATGAVREMIKLLGLAEPEKSEVKHDATESLMGIFANVVTKDDKPA